MHDAEHESAQNDFEVEIVPLPSDEELPAASFSSRPNFLTGKRLPRAWRYALGGSTLLIVLALILASLLTSGQSTMRKPAHSGLTHTTSTAAASTPTPPPLPAAVPNDEVNMTVVNGVAYAGTAYQDTSTQAVYALRTGDGHLLWYRNVDGPVQDDPQVVDGVVYVGTDLMSAWPNYIYALRASDGSLLWRYTINNISYNTMTVDHGVVYIAEQDGLSALQASSGALLWHYTTSDPGNYLPLVENNIVYISAWPENQLGMMNGQESTVYALRVSDGHLLWSYTAGGYASVRLVRNGMAYVFSDGSLTALRVSDGQPLWSRILDGWPGWSSLADDGTLYFYTIRTSNPLTSTDPGVDISTSVYAMQSRDGAILWHYSLNLGDGNNVSGGLWMDQGVVYLGVSNGDKIPNYIYALQQTTGALLWRHKLDAAVGNDAIIAGGVIYLTTSNSTTGSGAMYALRIDDGSQIWSRSLATPASSLIAAGPAIYLSTMDGNIGALQASNGSALWHYRANVDNAA